MKLKKDQHILLRMKKKNKIKKILITGANGFIGKHLKKKLFKLYKLDTPSKKKLNLNDKKKLKLYLQKTKPEIIIHLASSTKFKKKKNLEKKNQLLNTYQITVNLAEEVNKNCKLILFFGSIEEYGKCKKPFKETYEAKPISYYGKYKLKSFNKVKKIMKKKKMNFIWLRPSLTFGENDNKERFMGYIINSIKENKVINIRPGNQKRDYLFVHDLCNTILEMIKKYSKRYNCIINISAENYINLTKIPMIIEKIIKKRLKFKFLNQNNKNIDLLNSNKKLLKLFPDLKFHTFHDGLKKTLNKENLNG